MDLLDIFAGKWDKVFTGNYYKELPNAPDDNAITFEYEAIDPTEWHYQRLFSNVVTTKSSSCAIKTNTPLSYQVGSYVVLQNGKLYEIISVQEDYQSVEKQAFRYLQRVAGVDYVIRLVELPNAWELK